jgi:tol-pal system protein YbgF
MQMRTLIVVALLWAAGSATAQAALFDDNEARRAILDLRAKVASNEEQTRARLAELTTANQQLAEQIQQMRRTLVEMNNQLEALRRDMAQLRGTDEQLTRDVAEIQRRQSDIAQGVDERIRRFEPQTVSVDGKQFAADPEEKRLYDDAIATLRGGDFSTAATSLQNFVRRYPNSGYIDSARFWLGNALYGKRDYKEAVTTFRAFASHAPDHPRAPEALLALANSQLEMKDTRGARATLNELLKAYPQSEAAQAGKERLAALK